MKRREVCPRREQKRQGAERQAAARINPGERRAVHDDGARDERRILDRDAAVEIHQAACLSRHSDEIEEARLK